MSVFKAAACVCVRVCIDDDMIFARSRASAVEERELGPAYDDDDTPYVRVAGYPEGEPQPCTGIFDFSCCHIVSA